MTTNSPSHKSFASDSPEMADYVMRTFKPEDPILAEVRKRAAESGLPPIHVSPYDGLILEVLARAANAKKIVEIGTLAGYSGICLARALPEGGVLHTFEFEPKHAKVAQESFVRAGVDHKVVIHQGPALNNLPGIERQGPFDLVFIDADKGNYPGYLHWAQKHLRMGGLALADNAFAWGLLAAPDSDPRLKEEHNRVAKAAIEKVNQTFADPTGPFRGAMIPTGEGLAIGVKRA
ncbi:MAG: O-methyltransferase [Planctomycetota bacterium]|nr:O-methyltransferase [Planctomycetota bacterium]